jgi:hypothetical protein
MTVIFTPEPSDLKLQLLQSVDSDVRRVKPIVESHMTVDQLYMKVGWYRGKLIRFIVPDMRYPDGYPIFGFFY